MTGKQTHEGSFSKENESRETKYLHFKKIWNWNSFSLKHEDETLQHLPGILMVFQPAAPPDQLLNVLKVALRGPK